MQLSSLVTRSPLVARPMNAGREEKIALFNAVEKADQDYENAKLVADAMLQARSVVIEKILLTCGKGPFMYRGQPVRIIKRKSDDGKRVTYFFRVISKNEPEEID